LAHRQPAMKEDYKSSCPAKGNLQKGGNRRAGVSREKFEMGGGALRAREKKRMALKKRRCSKENVPGSIAGRHAKKGLKKGKKGTGGSLRPGKRSGEKKKKKPGRGEREKRGLHSRPKGFPEGGKFPKKRPGGEGTTGFVTLTKKGSGKRENRFVPKEDQREDRNPNAFRKKRFGKGEGNDRNQGVFLLDHRLEKGETGREKEKNGKGGGDHSDCLVKNQSEENKVRKNFPE